MNIDSNGLPVQSDGDAEDTLQRTGMITVGIALGGDLNAVPIDDLHLGHGLKRMLQVDGRPGVYKRHPTGNANNVSADQLVSAAAAWLVTKERGQLGLMFLRLLSRLGFAQNYRKMHEGTLKVPDLMVFRALPLMARIHPILYPIIPIIDLLLLPLAVQTMMPVWHDNTLIPHRRSQDDTDDNNTILTLAACHDRLPTPISKLACWLYKIGRPVNYGVTKLGAANNVQGALEWYHRKESGGNPEIAALWKPVVERVFYGK